MAGILPIAVGKVHMDAAVLILPDGADVVRLFQLHMKEVHHYLDGGAVHPGDDFGGLLQISAVEINPTKYNFI